MNVARSSLNHEPKGTCPTTTAKLRVQSSSFGFGRREPEPSSQANDAPC